MLVTKELLRWWSWEMVNWRNLLVSGGVLTIIGTVLPTLLLTDSPDTLFSSPPFTIPPFASLNGSLTSRDDAALVKVEQRYHQEGLEQLSPVSSSPIISANSTFKFKEENDTHSSGRDSSHRVKKKKTKENYDGMAAYSAVKSISPGLQKYINSLSPYNALVYAKKEIENTSLVTDYPYLHPPNFRNVSVFIRSYELMEMILKIYIYPNGNKPIFHTPHLKGIYASEGWFMKFMEANKQFVTRNPEKAHLFYLPYSARQLELALYVPDSHNMRPLSIFMRDYANMIASNYPFWNRTHGADHFLVACHDWGPYTLVLHEELLRNTIKALCNADVSEGIFVAGKDVSLPETTIRTPRRPLQNVGGGARVSQRPILAFFAGNMHGRVRPTLLKYWRNRDEDMRIYGPLPARLSRKMSYVQHMRSSRFCLCPMGYEVNSPRIVEAIYYECVPVIIADNFELPFSDFLDWSAFSVVVPEGDIPKLKQILLAIPLRKYLAMLDNLKMVQKHFLWNPRPLRFDLFHMILHSIWSSRVNHINDQPYINDDS